MNDAVGVSDATREAATSPEEICRAPHADSPHHLLIDKLSGIRNNGFVAVHP
jgi:hypothetical protein